MFRLPSKVDESDLKDKESSEKRLLADYHKYEAIRLFLYNKELTRIDNNPINGVNYKEKFGYTIEKFTAPDNSPIYCAIYYGTRRSKDLGAGGLGKVKLAQNIQTGEWYALKISKEESLDSLKEEYEILKQAELARGSNKREEIGKRKERHVVVKAQFRFLMALAPGQNLQKLIQQRELYTIELFQNTLTLPNDEALAKRFAPNVIYLNMREEKKENGTINYSLWCLVKNGNKIDKIPLGPHLSQKMTTGLQDLLSTKGKPIITKEQEEAVFKITSAYNKDYTPMTPQKRSNQMLNSVPLTNVSELLEASVKILTNAAHVYARGLVYRDYKPENIMYDAKDTRKMTTIDWGSAKKLSDANCNFHEGTTAAFVPNEVLEKCIVNHPNNTYQRDAVNSQTYWVEKNDIANIKWVMPKKGHDENSQFPETIKFASPTYYFGIVDGNWQGVYYEGKKKIATFNVINGQWQVKYEDAKYQGLFAKDLMTQLNLPLSSDKEFIGNEQTDDLIKLYHVENRIGADLRAMNDKEYQQYVANVIQYFNDLKDADLFTFNQKTDVYAIALIIGDLFNLTTGSKRKGYEGSDYANYYVIMDEAELNTQVNQGNILLPTIIRDNVIELLRLMTDPDPNKRPSFDQAFQQFFKIAGYYDNALTQMHKLDSIQKLKSHINNEVVGDKAGAKIKDLQALIINVDVSEKKHSKRVALVSQYFKLMDGGDLTWQDQLFKAYHLMKKNIEQYAGLPVSKWPTWPINVKAQMKETGLIGKLLANSGSDFKEMDLIDKMYKQFIASTVLQPMQTMYASSATSTTTATTATQTTTVPSGVLSTVTALKDQAKRQLNPSSIQSALQQKPPVASTAISTLNITPTSTQPSRSDQPQTLSSSPRSTTPKTQSPSGWVLGAKKTTLFVPTTTTSSTSPQQTSPQPNKPMRPEKEETKNDSTLSKSPGGMKKT